MSALKTFSATGDAVHRALLAALAADRSLADIARAAGIHWTALSRFKSREREIGTEGLERLALALGIEVVAAPTPRARRHHAAWMRNVAKATGTPVNPVFDETK